MLVFFCRHVQREHRHIAGRIPTKFGSTRVLPDPLVAAAAVAQAQQQQRLAAAASSSGLYIIDGAQYFEFPIVRHILHNYYYDIRQCHAYSYSMMLDSLTGVQKLTSG